MTTLSDVDILDAIDSQALIRNADADRVAGACYELRMGNVYYDLTEAGKRFALAPGEHVLIKPGHRVVLITAEELEVPADILVRVVSKGSLFSIGLSPVATYADPGFDGNLGIVTENVSDKYIELPQGEPIAKADFTRLTSAAGKLYQGQHGFHMGIWPIKTHFQKAHADVSGDDRVLSEKAEALALLPEATRSVIRRIESTQFITDIGLVCAIILNAIALFLTSGKFVDAFYGVVGNLVASAVLGIVLLVHRYLQRT
jgi:dCTP deaminase